MGYTLQVSLTLAEVFTIGRARRTRHYRLELDWTRLVGRTLAENDSLAVCLDAILARENGL